MDELRIGIEPELEARVRLAAVSAEEIAVEAGEALWRERIEPLCRELRQSYRAGTISRVPGVQHGRRLYRAIGLDPTSLRPPPRPCCAGCSKARNSTGSTRWWTRSTTAA